MATDIDRPISEAERILLRLREEIAQATERAGRDLHKLGIDWDVIEYLIMSRETPRNEPMPVDPVISQAVEAAIDRAADRFMARLTARYG
jgi:hypothetical protein